MLNALAKENSDDNLIKVAISGLQAGAYQETFNSRSICFFTSIAASLIVIAQCMVRDQKEKRGS